MSPGKNRAPLYEALVAHAQLQATAFHVPGHKQRGWEDAEAAGYYASTLALDVTELSDTDDLHHPQGPLAEAQELAAQCYDVDETRFLVGGSTSGNLSMIIGLCNPGDLVILQRNVHKSVIHGLMLAGVRAVLLPPDTDPISGLATLPGEELLAASLKKHRDAKAVILSAPNYYGMSPDLRPLIQLSHKYGIPVLVDEAHGPHFGFHPHFPSSALQADADIVVHSTHKMLSAMTMGAMLHMQGNRVPRQAVRQALTMVQSSSPSFPILASLDLARRQLHVEGGRTFQSALEAVTYVIKRLEETPFRAIGYGNYINPGISYDPLKLVLFDESGRLSGFELRDQLLSKNCVAEMADSRYVVMAFGTGSKVEDGERLSKALAEIAIQIRDIELNGQLASAITISTLPKSVVVPEPVLIKRGDLPKKAVELTKSVGMTAAEWVIPYPPGIPILYPGELLTAQIIEELQHWSKLGAQIQGVQDTELKYIQVQQS